MKHLMVQIQRLKLFVGAAQIRNKLQLQKVLEYKTTDSHCGSGCCENIFKYADSNFKGIR